MNIPIEVKKIVSILENKDFQAFVVGGCVRDLLLGIEPNDWDVTTNANPKELEKIFPKSFNVNKFGTVTVLTASKKDNLKEIEITTFRTEEKYTDKRHPDKVKWAKTIEQDLGRRDFTVNAIALKIPNPKSRTNSKFKIQNSKFILIDPFNGQKDLEDKLIRAVGKPEERFQEDALRLMRAIRFATVLDFNIEKQTLSAIKKNTGLLEFISKERIRDEFLKIVMSDNPAKGVELLRETGLLKYIVPELLEGYQVGQNKHHIYEVYEHGIRSLQFGAKENFNKYVRIAALFHDIGKPRAKEGQGADSTFYNHEVIGAKMTAKILERLKFPKKDIEKIVRLVRYHLFYYNVGEVQESSVRRLLAKVGPENFEELVQLRTCDRIGSGCPKAMPYKLRHFQYVAERLALSPIDTTTLKVGGDDIMEILKIEPGQKIGKILAVLLGEVLDEPKNNKKTYLKKRIKGMGGLSEKELEQLAKGAKEKREEIVTKRDEMTKKKYWVS
ncbi:HD domain-containing protein [Patescibacteria group bacterium]|nr:HD domain-containing protein [Patescibacteria group bacterium]MBU4162373.1 HD domain-containing protein [Patescibacteria group bacterium]